MTLSVVAAIFDNLPSTAGTTTYAPLAGRPISVTTESKVQVPIRTAGSFSNLYIRITANTCNGTIRYALRDNGVTVNNFVDVLTGQTGEFEDVTHSDTITAGHLYNYAILPGATTGTNSISIFRLLFQDSTAGNTSTLLVTSGSNQAGGGALALAAASTTWYFVIAGQGGNTTTETEQKCRQRKPGTFRYLAVNVSANTRTTQTDIRTRIDPGTGSVNGNQIVSYTSGQTGIKEDITNSDSVSTGYDVNTSLTTGTGSGTITLQQIALSYLDTNGFTQCCAGINAGAQYAVTTAKFTGITGTFVATGGNETNVSLKATDYYRFSDMTTRVTLNTAVGNGVMTFRKNGSNGNQTIIILGSGSGGPQTGVFSDATNTDLVNTTDEVCYQFVAGTAAATTISTMSSWAIYQIRVLQNRTLKYNIRKQITHANILKYNVRRLVLSSTILKYNLRKQILSSRIVKYNLRRLVISSRILKYNIRLSVKNPRVLRYAIRKQITHQQTLKYNLRQRIVHSQTLKYSLFGLTRVLHAQILKYNLRQQLKHQNSIKYNMRKSVTKTQTLEYRIKQRVKLAQTLKYSLFGAMIRVTRRITIIYEIMPVYWKMPRFDRVLETFIRNNYSDDIGVINPPSSAISWGKVWDAMGANTRTVLKCIQMPTKLTQLDPPQQVRLESTPVLIKITHRDQENSRAPLLQNMENYLISMIWANINSDQIKAQGVNHMLPFQYNYIDVDKGIFELDIIVNMFFFRHLP